MFVQWMNVSTYLSFTCNYHITQLWFRFIWQIDFAIKLPANNSSGRFSHCLLVTKQVLLLRQHCETFTSGKPGPTVTVHGPLVLVSKLILHTDTEKQRPSPPANISVGITDSRNKNPAGNSASGSGSCLFPSQLAACLVHSRASVNAYCEVSCSSRSFRVLRCFNLWRQQMPPHLAEGPGQTYSSGTTMQQLERNNRPLLMKIRISYNCFILK